MKIQFTVFGNPKAQMRHRTGKGYHYDPSEGDKGDFLAMVMSHAPDMLIKEPIKLSISFYFPRPGGHFNKKGEVKKQFLVESYAKIPDADNLAKFVMDTLNGRIWSDDKLVWDLHVYKLNAGGPYEGKPRTEVIIEWDDAEGGVK